MKMKVGTSAVLALACLAEVVFSATPPVVIEVHAPWKSTPVEAEASELLASESNQLFWNFAESFTQGTDEQVSTQITDFVTSNLPPLAVDIFKAELEARAASAAVEAILQVSRGRASILLDGQPECKTAFFESAGKHGCTTDAMGRMLNSDADHQGVSRGFSNDHVYPSGTPVDLGSDHVVIIYGVLGTPEFKAMHEILKPMAIDGKIAYIFRHYYTNLPDVPLQLPGWGVELDVKKMDYKAVDDAEIKDEDGTSDTDQTEEIKGFDFKTLRSRLPEKSEQLNKLKEYLVSTRATIRDMKVWELQDIDIQAASRIVRNSNPIKALQEISQNFPILADSILTEKVNDSMLAEVRENQEAFKSMGLEPGGSLFAINSRVLDPITSDIFTLFTYLRADAKMLAAFSSVGFPVDTVSQLTSLSAPASAGDDVVLDIRTTAVNFVNDLEYDSRYSNWPADVMSLLRPAYPGQQRRLRKNLFTVVFAIDISTDIGMKVLASIRELINNDVPVRFGVIFGNGGNVDSTHEFSKEKTYTTTESELTDAVAQQNIAALRCMAYIKKEESVGDGFAFLEHLALKSDNGQDENFTVDNIIQEFGEKFGKEVAAKLLKPTGNKKSKLQKKGEKAIHELGIGPDLHHVRMFFNGKMIDIRNNYSTAAIEEIITTNMAEMTPHIQRGLYYGQIKQTANFYDYFLTQPGVTKRINENTDSLKGRTLQFIGAAHPLVGSDAPTPVSLSTNDLIMSIAHDNIYIEQASDKPKVSTHWLAVDLESKKGKMIALEAMKRLLSDKKGRVALIHNAGKHMDEGVSLSAIVFGAIHVGAADSKALINTVGNILLRSLNASHSGTVDLWLAGVDETQKSAIVAAAQSPAVVQRMLAHTAFCKRALGVTSSINMWINNGKMIGPIGDNGVDMLDFKTLDQRAYKGVAAGVLSIVTRVVKGAKASKVQLSETPTNMVMMATAILDEASSSGDDKAEQETRLDTKSLSILKRGPSAIIHQPDIKEGEFFHHIVAVLDPLSKEAQHLTPILAYLSQVTTVKLEIMLNPKEKISEKPLNRFYRTVLPNVDETKGTVGAFRGLPTSPILTVNMHVPPAWMVQGKNSPYDLDNIHLDSAPNGVSAIFALEYLMVEGRAFTDAGAPAAGLQLELGTPQEGALFDTIVMANLGYFQLKAAPGAWDVSLREGRSSQIFKFGEVIGAEASADLTSTVILNKFTGKDMSIQVVRNPGMEKMELLETTTEDEKTEGDDKSDDGLWASLKNLAGMKEEANADEKDLAKATGARSGETINIFSLASGHLYERFMKLMMLSVLKGTNNPVKFWFLKNCMSPQMQDFLPYFAAEYGFEYELVQYKWPAWLNIPPTRHRQIWGYKILFLDVLFPLDVKKIIFVDADQIIRADMKELVDIDLEGAPYGYTPFCSDKKEMDGFRFWNSGYWKGHLAGRPYHISALYVVDLIRFRQLAAGDRLREQYQGLSRDPNSLSNLDQDLPNNMVHQVPIKSLPQEWLWCETWCSDDIKGKAKTIDLCNNPLTKEPKLEAAVRIVGEWVDLDYEAKNVTSRAEALIAQGVPSTYKPKKATVADKVGTDAVADVDADKADSHTEEL